MLTRFFHAWERRLAAATDDRVVRPFEWGVDWLDGDRPPGPDAEALITWAAQATRNSHAFYDTPPTDAYTLDDGELRFPSVLATPHPENNTVHARYFPATQSARSRRAVVILPHWNAKAEAHVALAQLIARAGISSLRLSLPYHDRRMPPELHRADYIVSANVGRTLQVCRQAVLDARRAVHWLERQGYERIGIVGTSLGSCLAMLTAAHEPRLRVAALNHISPYFADVVWEGLSTAHVRAGLDAGIDLDRLRQAWLPISPYPYIDQMQGKVAMLIYARYDLSFPVRLSKQLVEEFRARALSFEVRVLPCGHYSSGLVPFSWLDGYSLVSFLRRRL